MKIKFAFWGTDEFSTNVLEELKAANLIPSLIITAPDRPAGRGNKMQSPAVKIWADENNLKVLQPEKLDEDFLQKMSEENWDMFALASYGKIIPQNILDLPAKGTLNVHPSLLPKYRGASPIESAMLDDAKETGVTIMLMDDKMDHGPILSQESVFFDEWPTRTRVEEELSHLGGQMLADAMQKWLDSSKNFREQNHDDATFTQKISKEDGAIKFEDLTNPEEIRTIFLKIKALNPWPGVFFFIPHLQNGVTKEIRVKIKDADFVDGNLQIKSVVPEGKKEMSWEDFQKGFLSAKS